MEISPKISNINTVWTIKSEFGNLKYSKITSDLKFVGFINKWIKIMLLRENIFFQSKLSIDEYDEFINKINKYKNTFGDSNDNISLYFTEYNFSDSLADKILTIRNHYGIILLFLLAYPYDLFENELSIFSKELKKLNENFSLRSLLQEVSFDLGCSSYALGKIYDYLMKIYEIDQEQINEVTNIDFEIYSSKVINSIKTMIQIFENNNNYNFDEKNLINFIKNKQKNYLPLDFVISNRLLIHFFKCFLKF